jgi:tRNA-specific 2-thiouridylase
MTKKRVLVAMSGGVDSSVAAFLLKQKGFEVIGATMCFGLEDSKTKRPSCCSISGIEDAKRVAEQLDIPHYTLSFGKLLKTKVIDEFVKEYLSGRTPNPCILCNQYLKFGALEKKAKELNCDYLATGHYARISRDKKGKYFLRQGKDAKKDQSYFLFRIPKPQMKHILFPLGNLTKDEVRKIARDNKLRVADKPASQEVCFIGTNYHEFLRARIPTNEIKPGPIVNTDSQVLGEHKGIPFYTIGQRGGLGIAYKHALYVVGIDKKTNTVIADEKNKVYKSKLRAKQIYLSGLDSLSKKLEVQAKIRYNHPKAKALIFPSKKRKITVEFYKPQWAITPGQSVVFYKGDKLIGGATIEEAVE